MRTVILFSGKTCGYCRPVKVMIEDLKVEYEDNESVGFLTRVIDAEPESLELAKSYGVQAIPTVVLLNGKNLEAKWVGQEITQEALINGIEGNL